MHRFTLHSNSGRQFLLIMIFCYIAETNGHGMLMEPPNRSSIWRVPEFNKYNATKNWNDNGLYCGGIQTLFETNGRCGVCGDPYDENEPRDNEDGGIYDNGIVVRKYKAGQVIPIEVNLTTTHLGYFELRLCAKDDTQSHLDQSCYDKHVLELVGYTKPSKIKKPKLTTTTASSSKSRPHKQPPPTSPPPERNTKYYITTDAPHEYFSFKVRLPKRVKCRNCVLQWEYVTGNSWNFCDESLRGKLGCGIQEMFRNCADISIMQ